MLERPETSAARYSNQFHASHVVRNGTVTRRICAMHLASKEPTR